MCANIYIKDSLENWKSYFSVRKAINLKQKTDQKILKK